MADLADEHLLQDPDTVPAWRDVATEVRDGTRYPVPAMTLRQAVESVAADAGIVVVPMSLARLHHRKDVVAVPVTGVPTTKVGLTWLVGRRGRAGADVHRRGAAAAAGEPRTGATRPRHARCSNGVARQALTSRSAAAGPRWKPAADWMPTTARSWNSSRVRAPA